MQGINPQQDIKLGLPHQAFVYYFRPKFNIFFCVFLKPLLKSL